MSDVNNQEFVTHKKTIMTQRFFLIVAIAFMATNLFGQLSVGDPGVTFDKSKFDADYPQMVRWSKAGVRGGIPFLTDLPKGTTVTSKTSAGINEAIKNCAADEYVYLPNGMYKITSTIKMKSRVHLVGQSRDGVICEIDMKGGVGFEFNGVNNCGIYKMTIQGSWGEPRWDWNFGSGTASHDEYGGTAGNDNISVRFKSTNDCFLDGVNVYNSSKHPIWINAKHITLRDLHVDGVHRKGGGCEGYLMVANSDNLITDCFITHLRHLSLQGGSVEYNVLYNNILEQEISYHAEDNGNNLVEGNIITLPSDMWGAYYALMGPWSTQHHLSKKPNYAYKNKCYHYNQGASVNPLSPWSDDNVVYYGPHKVKPANHQGKINNFTTYPKGVPQGGSLYPVELMKNDDTKAPSAPSDLWVSNINTDACTLSWSASSDNVGVTAYKIFRDGELLKTVTTTSSEIEELDCATSYSFIVKAKDNAGNHSLNSNTLTLTTANCNAASEQTVVLNPIQDAYIQGIIGYNNSLIRVENGRRVGYLKFDLRQVSNNILSAKLKLTCSGDGGNGEVNVSEGTSSNWTESNLNSNNKPTSSNILATIDKTYSVGNTYVWSLDVNKLLDSDFISLILSQNNGNDVAFASKENNAGKPQLEITFDTSLKNANTPTNINKTLSKVNVFPNPFSNVLSIKLNSCTVKAMQLVDINGAVVYKSPVAANSQCIEVQTSFLEAGFYFLQLQGDANSQSIKVLKK